MIKPEDFNPQGIDKCRQGLADVLPRGRIFFPKNQKDSQLYKFLRAIAKQQNSYESLIDQIIQSYIPNFKNSYIVEWENCLGIPDDCFSNTGTELERRRNIAIKLAYLSLKTTEDYFNLATLLGIDISIYRTSNNARCPLTFPITMGSPFVIELTVDDSEDLGFPYTLPITFGGANVKLFVCLIKKYKKCYIDVIIKYTDPETVLPTLDANGESILNADGDFVAVEIEE